MLKKNDLCKWKHSTEKLIYLGKNFSGNGYWHQFAKVETPDVVWCEVVDGDLYLLEKIGE